MPSGNAFQSVGGRWLPLKTGCISVHNLLGYNLIFYFGFGAPPKQEVYIGLGGGSQLICLIYKLPQATDVQLRYDLGSTQTWRVTLDSAVVGHLAEDGVCICIAHMSPLPVEKRLKRQGFKKRNLFFFCIVGPSSML